MVVDKVVLRKGTREVATAYLQYLYTKEGQDIMLVSDGGQIIRLPVKDIRIAGRKTQGVTVFRVDANEKVVSVAALEDTAEEESGNGNTD